MIVRLVVRPKEAALVQHLVHATRFEPVDFDAAQGRMAFNVPFRRVEAVLNRLAKSGVGEFEAYFDRSNESE